MDTTSNLNKEIFDSIIERKITVVDLTLDKENEENWLPDRHTSKLGNEKKSFSYSKIFKGKFILRLKFVDLQNF